MTFSSAISRSDRFRHALLDKDVVDQAVDDVRGQRGVVSPPEDDAGRCEDFEGVEHRFGFVSQCTLGWRREDGGTCGFVAWAELDGGEHSDID